MRKSMEVKAAGDYKDWISNSIELYGELGVMCHECQKMIAHAGYHKYKNGEVLCDECAKAKYQTHTEEELLTCSECGNYISFSKYWDINGEVLCNDCERAKYKYTIEGLYDV